jgi:dipeptidyl aminopeptidase/acylaminoacyl peptidase
MTRSAVVPFAMLSAVALFGQTPDATTPAPQDIPTPIGGEIGLAGARCPDISRYLNVRSATAPSLSPDGTMLAYSTGTTGTPQLWVVASGGGAPRQITFGEPVTFHDWSPTSDWIAYGVDRGGNEREGYYLISADGRRERELLPPSDSFRQWGGWSRDGTRIAFAASAPGSADFDVYTLEVAGTKPPVKALPGRGGNFVAAWRPDGRGILLRRPRGEDSNDLLYLDLASGKVEALLAPAEPSAHRWVSWKPDGSGFYLVTDHERDLAGVAFYDMTRRSLQWIATPAGEVEAVDLSADGRYLVWSVNTGGFSQLHLTDTDVAGERPIKLDLPAGVLGSIEWAPAGPRMAITLSAPDVPSDIWTFDAENETVTRATESSLAGLDSGTFIVPETVSFRSHDGETIFGLMYVPLSATKDRRAPVVLAVHGGPNAQARPRFNAVHQYLLARGYAVLDLNFRGSTGFGKRFARLDDQRLRPNAVKDMGSAVDWMAGSNHPIDPTRVAVMGGSYGGFMAFAALTQLPDRFRAGVGFVGVSNLVTALAGASPQLKASDRIEYGNIDDPEDREFLRELSPLTHIANVRAPLMVLHGANDPRDPVTEADQMVRAIRERGGDVEYLRFPDEGHGIRRLSNRIIAFRRVAAFLERTLGGGVTECGEREGATKN